MLEKDLYSLINRTQTPEEVLEDYFFEDRENALLILYKVFNQEIKIDKACQLLGKNVDYKEKRSN